MPCNITAPDIQTCNDLQGGVKKVEIAAWADGANPSSYTVIPVMVNSASGKDTPNVNPANQTTSFTHEVYFKVNGNMDFIGYADLVSSRIVAKLTLYDGTALTYGIENGLSYSGGEKTTGLNMEDASGITFTYTGVSTVPAAINIDAP